MGAHKDSLLWLPVLALLAVTLETNPARAQGREEYSAPKLPTFIDRRRLPDLQAVTVEAEAKRRAEAEAKRKAEEEAKRKADEEARLAAEAEAKRKAEEERRLAAEAEAKRKAEEEAKRKVEEERRLAAEAEAKRKAEEEAMRKVEEERRQAAEAEAKRKTEEERRASEPKQQAAAAPPNATGSADGPTRVGPTAARLGAPPGAVAPRAGACGPAKVTTSPVAGGRVSLTVESPCRPRQKVTVSYGGFEFVGALDGEGRLTMLVDLFLGKDQSASVGFGGEERVSVTLDAPDLDQVSKVAVVWKRPINLDLHAYEYAAPHGQPGHVWAGRPESAEATLTQARESGRGAGFLSTVDDGRHEGDKVEVYTFWHNAEQTSGNVAFALDYETRGSEPKGDTCEGGRDAEVPFEIVLLTSRGNIQRESGLIKSAKCGERLTERARYAGGAVPDLRIRQR